MNLTLIVFYLFVALVSGASFMLWLSKNVLYSAFFLLATLLGISALYVFLGADFLAITQIVVYVGGILVILLFGVMLTNPSPSTKERLKVSPLQPQSGWKNIFWGVLLGATLLAIFIRAIQKADFANRPWILEAQSQEQLVQDTTIPTLGVGLMTDYIVPFEIIAILLLVALVGASLVAAKQKD